MSVVQKPSRPVIRPKRSLAADVIPIDSLDVSAYTVPTDQPESDGTLQWDKTTLVLVEPQAGGKRGIGYTYADKATAVLIQTVFADLLRGQNALAISHCWQQMVHRIRNLGRAGICSMAISAVDVALWDLKAKLLGVPLATLLGPVRESVPIYGSGGFTSYNDQRLSEQLGGWAKSGISKVKMKVGRQPEEDPRRVRLAREAIGSSCRLFVDANGAYQRKQALAIAQPFADCGVTWFEEPVSSDDLEGLRLLRDRVPPEMEIAAGEYGYDSTYFRRMLAAQAVDVLQADATRCGGITGFLNAAALCHSFGLPLSSHCAPALHLAVCCAALPVVHMEYFHDHVRIEKMLFDGAPAPSDGKLKPDNSRPGIGCEFKRADAQRWAIAL